MELSLQPPFRLIQNFNYVMGESGCTLTVLDVADNLQTRYAFISGGSSSGGAPIITFSSSSRASEVSEEEYRNVVTYLTSIPSLQEVDVGFVVIIDRRRESWTSAKTLLLRISGFFPGQVHEVFLLRPSGFLQRTLAEVGFKRIKDDLKFKVCMCETIGELHTHIDPSQLTDDLGGTLLYDHKEWIQHRAAIEKFSANTTQIGNTIRELCSRLQEAEFPNDVTTTETLIQSTTVSKAEIKDDLKNTIKHGEILLACFKGSPPKDLSFDEEDGEKRTTCGTSDAICWPSFNETCPCDCN
ncbi:Guanine nucleotide exchange factor DBS [Lamellibrachia satsuma]|nr:Guanine nucleotide exchange factor DBS [Lamellibrachia satsuma]